MKNKLINISNILAVNKNYKLFIILGIITIIVYGPFICNGGIGSGQDTRALRIGMNKSSSLVSIVTSRTSDTFMLHAPLGSRLMKIWIKYFKEFHSLSILFSTVLLILVAYLLYPIVKIMLGQLVAVIFSFFSILPIIASDIIESHMMFASHYNVSIMFWTLSLNYMNKYLLLKKGKFYLLSYLILIISLITFPLAIPLLVLSAFYPIVYETGYLEKIRIKEIRNKLYKYVVPVALIFLAYYVYKIYIVNSNYGILKFNIKSILQFLYFYVVILVEIPIVLIEVIPHLLNGKVLLGGSLTVLFFIFIYKNYSSLNHTSIIDRRKERRFIVLIMVTLVGCSLFFFVSQRGPTTFGYANRYMFPSFLMISILAGLGFKYIFNSRLRNIIIPIAVLWISSMIVQLENFTLTAKYRRLIINDFSNKINEIDLGYSPVVIACVPGFLENNYNNEAIFFPMDPWIGDFMSGVSLYGDVNIKNIKIFPFNWGTIYREKKFLFTDNYIEYNYHNHTLYNSNLWYYVYNQKSKISQLIKIQGKTEFERLIEMINKNRINYHPLIIRENLRNFIKTNVLKFYKNIPKI